MKQYPTVTYWLALLCCGFINILGGVACDTGTDESEDTDSASDDDTDDGTDDDSGDDTDDDTDDDVDDDVDLPGYDGLDDNPAWCRNGYATAAGGCIEQITGGIIGSANAQVAVDSEDVAYVVAERGREIVLYAVDNVHVLRTWILSRMGRNPQLDLGSNGDIHVVYRDWVSGAIEYVGYQSGSWIRDTIADPVSLPETWMTGDFSNLRMVVANDLVNVMFRDDLTLVLVTGASGGWSFEPVEEFEEGFGFSLTKAPDDTIWIALMEGGGPSIRVGHRESSGWEFEHAVEPNAYNQFDDGSNPELALDSSGTVAVCWELRVIEEGGDYNLVEYTTNEGNAWRTFEVDEGFSASCRVWLGETGEAQVLFAPSGLDNPVSVFSSTREDRSHWNERVIDAYLDNIGSPNWSRKEPDRPLIVFGDSGNLKAAWLGGTLTPPAVVDKTDVAAVAAATGSDGTLVVASLLDPKGIEVEWIAPDGTHSVEDLTSLMITEPDFISIGVGANCAVIYQNRDAHPDESLFRLLRQRDGVWSKVNYRWAHGAIGSSSMAVADDCSIHLFAVGDHSLVYHTSDESGVWQDRLIAVGGTFVTGALDRTGEPAVAYGYNETRLARRESGVWSDRPLCSTPFNDSRLAFDADNRYWFAGTSFAGADTIALFHETSTVPFTTSIENDQNRTFAMATVPNGVDLLRSPSSDLVISRIENEVWTEDTSIDVDSSRYNEGAALFVDEHGHRTAIYLVKSASIIQRVDAQP